MEPWPPNMLRDTSRHGWPFAIDMVNATRTKLGLSKFTPNQSLWRQAWKRADREATSERPLRIYCSILVEQASQKPIVIGRRGARIREIGTSARHELERFFATPVYLDLHVKVKPGWRENERLLDELGVGRVRR